MSRSLTTGARASIFAEQTGEVWLALLTISGTGMTTIRVVNNNEDIVSRGNTFQWLPFDIVLPPEEADSVPKAVLRIDHVDKRVVEAVRSITVPPTVMIEVIMASDPEHPELTLDNLILRNVQFEGGYVTGELLYESIYTEPLTYTMTPSRFPGLF